MEDTVKDWLVRTRSGEILGPYSQRELLDELKRRTFTPEDEIAQSRGMWISAQTLTGHDVDEFTLTHTRNQTVTKSIHQITSTGTLSTAEETLTPSDFSLQAPYPPRANEPLAPVPPVARRAPAAGNQKLAPFLFSAMVVGGIWFLVTSLKPREKSPLSPPNQALQSASNTPREAESPFVRQVYTLIAAGEPKEALKLLNQYHEKHQAKGDLEYLVPYAALLISEGDSPSRARKFLEMVLGSQGSLYLKSRAHHWLGFLFLSEGEGDMGESHFLEALQLNPKDPAARFNLGRAYLKQKKYSQALDYLNLAELEVPDLWLVHIYKGRAKAAMGNIEEARTAFKKAVECSPDRWITYLYYAVFLNAIKENDIAQITIKKMLTRDPQYEANSPPPWGFYEEKVPYSEYLDTFEDIMAHAIAEDREMGKLYINYLMNSSGNESKRIEQIAEKGNIMARVLALKVALDRDSPLDVIKAATARLPAQLKEFGYYAYVLRGDARTRMSLFNEALQDLQSAMVLEPQSAVARWAYAVLLKKSGREADAQSEIKSLLSYHPNYIPAIVSTHNF